jgi:probable HAF family extracellular repeat protein
MLAVLLAPTAVNAQTTVKYHVVKLPEVPAPSGCVPTAINENGDVVGYCNAAGSESFGVLWSGGAVTDLGRLAGGTFTHAWGINSSGQIVGDGNDTTSNLDPKAVILGAAGWVGLDGSGGSAQAAYGITDNGVIYGNFTTQRHPGTETWDPVYWTYDASHDRWNRHNLPKPAGTLVSGAFIYAATKIGVAAGQVASDLVGNQAGLWLADAAHTLIVLEAPNGFASGAAFGISEDARAAGSASNVSGSHAIVWQNDAAHTAVDLGTLPGDDQAEAHGVNASGQVVGSSFATTPSGVIERAFLYQNGAMAELSTLLDPSDAGWTVNRAVGINNSGQIIAVATNNGQQRAIVLMPAAFTCSAISVAIPSSSAAVGAAFSASVNASGGTAPYSYSLDSGAVPGLTLSAGGLFAGTPTTAGDFSVTVGASDANGCSGTATATMLVSKGTPMVSWSTPSPIAYGAALGASQLNATASVPGSFVYSPVAGTVLPAGAGQLLSTTFTPDDSANYDGATATVTIDVGLASQTIAFAPLAARTYGDAAFAVSATGGASGNPVTFAASGACTLAGDLVSLTGAGSCTVTASQAGNSNYSAAADVAQTFTVAQASQTITFGALANRTYGDAAFAVSATGGASGNAVSFAAAGACSVAGNLVTITGAGSCTITATQAGNANYLPATAVPESFSIAKGSSSVNWAAPAAITYGTPLGAAQLNATVTMAGTFVYSPVAGTVLGAGDHLLSVTFTPSDANISGASASVALHVNQAVPVVTWATPADITEGTPLGAVQLNASANVPGAFAYSPAAGIVLPIGSGQTLSVVFTPADAANYTSAAASVLINVVAIQPPPADNILAPIADQQNAEGDRVELQLQTTGVARRDKVAFIAANLPPGLDIDKEGVVKGRIRRGSAGQYQVTVTLFANRTSYTRSFVWTVTR